jgi:hypothetical protein
MDSGFAAEDEYSTYSKPLFDRSEASTVYRPKKDDSEMYGDVDAQMSKLSDTSRFKADKGFKGADSAGDIYTNLYVNIVFIKMMIYIHLKIILKYRSMFFERGILVALNGITILITFRIIFVNILRDLIADYLHFKRVIISVHIIIFPPIYLYRWYAKGRPGPIRKS